MSWSAGSNHHECVPELRILAHIEPIPTAGDILTLTVHFPSVSTANCGAVFLVIFWKKNTWSPQREHCKTAACWRASCRREVGKHGMVLPASTGTAACGGWEGGDCPSELCMKMAWLKVALTHVLRPGSSRHRVGAMLWAWRSLKARP